MRLADSGRSAHPKLRPSSLRLYVFGEDDSEGGARDLARASDASCIDNNPAVVDCPTGRARRFFESPAASLKDNGDAESQDAARLDWTIGVLMRIHTEPTADGTLFGLMGPDDTGAEASANNYLIHFWLAANRVPNMTWEHSAGTDVTKSAATYVVPLYGWNYVVWRKSATTAVGPGGTCTLAMFINGHKVEEWTGVVNCSDGTNAVWRIGHNSDGIVEDSNPNVDFGGCYAWQEALTDDEIADDTRRLWLLPFFARSDLRVILNTSQGFVDLSDFEGVDFLDHAEMDHSNDDPCRTAQITLMREVENLSLATLRTDTKLNLTNPANPATYDPVLHLTGDLEMWAARVPLGIRATPRDEQSVFHGVIDEIEEGGPDTTVLHCRDSGALLIDTWIEEIVTYGDDAGVAVEGEMQFILNDNDNDPGNDSVAGLTQRDGSYGAPTLYVPTSPSWAVKRWKQRRESVWAALRALAGQIGWEVGYLYDQNPDDPGWKLTLFDPGRARVDVDVCLSVDDVIDIPEFKTSVFPIRTVARVTYPSTETTLPTITPPAGYTATIGWNNVDGEGARMMAFIQLSSDAGLPKYGRRFMEMAEASSSQVDTITEAFAMDFGALQDTEEPDLNQGILMPSIAGIEVMDIMKTGPNILTTGSQRLAVKSLNHSWGDQATSRFQLRGKPAIGWRRWLHLETRNGAAGAIVPTDSLADTTVTGRLSAVRALIETTSYLKGGKFLALRNPSFEAFSHGIENFPDGWGQDPEDPDETWGPAGDFYVEATSLTGARSLLIQNVDNTRVLVSDLVAFNGSNWRTVTIEALWQRKTAGSAYGVAITVYCYDAAKAFLGFAGASPSFNDGGSTTAGAWFAERAEGIGVIANTAYIRVGVAIFVAGPNVSDVLLDSVHAYNTANELAEERFNDQANAGAPPGGHDKWQNIQWDAVTRNYANVRPTPAFPGTGNGFYAQEPGTYTVDGAVGVDSGTVGLYAAVRLVKNATYNAAGFHVTGSGTIVWTGLALPLPPKAAVGLTAAGVNTYANVLPLAHTFRLERGDVLQAEWYADGNNVDVIGTVNMVPTGSTGGTNWDVKQKLAD